MKRYRWSIILGITLLAASALFYALQVSIYHDWHTTGFYMLQDLAFLPIQVLLVTLILNDLLSRRGRLEMQTKMNMVIGAFYSEMGTGLLHAFRRFDAHEALLCPALLIDTAWRAKEFTLAKQAVLAHRFAIGCRPEALTELKRSLLAQRPMLLTLLENPNLLEHETFTDLLWAVSHLTEELAYRESMRELPASDLAHLATDIQRAYRLLLIEWLSYVQHLHVDYPYIYSLIVRMNPFNQDASAIVR